MSIGLNAGPNIPQNIEDFFKGDDLNKLMLRMDKWEKKDGWRSGAKARGANFGVLGIDLTLLFHSIIKVPVYAATQPVTMLIYAGATLTNKLMLTLVKYDWVNIDKKENESHRKILQVLPKIIDNAPTVIDLTQTILNIVKYAIGFFSSLTVGFISVNANIWVHHKLGLVCNPEMAKQDRKDSIISAAQNVEDSSLADPYIGKIKKEKREVQEILGVKLSSREIKKIKTTLDKGINYEEIDKKGLVKAAIDKATNEKRNAVLEELEQQRGEPLSYIEKKLISDGFWKILSAPFEFKINDELPKEYQTFLHRYFNWKVILPRNANPKDYLNEAKYFPQPFAFKADTEETKDHRNAYMKEYYLWNLTPEEVDEVKESIYTEECKQSAVAQVEKKHADHENEIKNEKLEKESKYAVLDERITNALAARADEKKKIKKWMKACIAVEKAILNETIKTKQQLSQETIDQIIKKQNYAFDEKDEQKFHQFAVQAPEIPENKMNDQLTVWDNMLEQALTEPAKIDENETLKVPKLIDQSAEDIEVILQTRQVLMPTEHYFDLKNKVIRHMQFEFCTSNPIHRDGVDYAITAKVEEKIKRMIQKEPLLRLKNSNQKSVREQQAKPEHERKEIDEILSEKIIPLTKEEKEHIDKIEKPRLYQKLWLKKMFPATSHIFNEKKDEKANKTAIERGIRKRNEIVYFDGLEEKRKMKFDELIDVFYELEKAGGYNFDVVAPGHDGRPKLYERKTKTYRKDTWDDQCKKIVELKKETVLSNKECSNVTLSFAQDDFHKDTKITFEEYKRVLDENGSYVRGQDGYAKTGDITYHTTTFKELREVKLGGREWKSIKPDQEGYPVISEDTKYIKSPEDLDLYVLQKGTESGSIKRRKIFEQAAEKANGWYRRHFEIEPLYTEMDHIYGKEIGESAVLDAAQTARVQMAFNNIAIEKEKMALEKKAKGAKDGVILKIQ